jgi:hypothetical protein
LDAVGAGSLIELGCPQKLKDLLESINPPDATAKTDRYLDQKTGYLRIEQLTVLVKPKDLLGSIDSPNVSTACKDLSKGAGYLLKKPSVRVEPENLIRSIDSPAPCDIHEGARYLLKKLGVRIKPKDLLGSIDPPDAIRVYNEDLYEKARNLLKKLSVAVKSKNLLGSIDPPDTTICRPNGNLHQRAPYLLKKLRVGVKPKNLLRSIDPPGAIRASETPPAGSDLYEFPFNLPERREFVVGGDEDILAGIDPPSAATISSNLHERAWYLTK